jgi:hypothetical protein
MAPAHAAKHGKKVQHLKLTYSVYLDSHFGAPHLFAKLYT